MQSISLVPFIRTENDYVLVWHYGEHVGRNITRAYPTFSVYVTGQVQEGEYLAAVRILNHQNLFSTAVSFCGV